MIPDTGTFVVNYRHGEDNGYCAVVLGREHAIRQITELLEIIKEYKDNYLQLIFFSDGRMEFGTDTAGLLDEPDIVFMPPAFIREIADALYESAKRNS